jgi:imidazole glycerol-phosphate synthase subunit HisF
VLKKRLIFTLLFDGTYFVLSRNFRLQTVGDLLWLQKNYNFENTARSIDELVVLNVSREKSDLKTFSEAVRSLSKGCFVPISAGGGIRSIEDAGVLLKSGADKVVINTMLITDCNLVQQIANKYGKQCIVASIDVKRSPQGRFIQYIDSGKTQLSDDPRLILQRLQDGPIGEIYLNSMDRDGTGQGYDMDILELLPINCTKPVILAGGVGNSIHLDLGLRDNRVDAVATAHLFNFVGDGLKIARSKLIDHGHPFPLW